MGVPAMVPALSPSRNEGEAPLSLSGQGVPLSPSRQAVPHESLPCAEPGEAAEEIERPVDPAVQEDEVDPRVDHDLAVVIDQEVEMALARLFAPSRPVEDVTGDDAASDDGGDRWSQVATTIMLDGDESQVSGAGKEVYLLGAGGRKHGRKRRSEEEEEEEEESVVLEEQGDARRRAAHGALPHRAPSPRRTPNPVHHVWHRRGAAAVWPRWTPT